MSGFEEWWKNSDIATDPTIEYAEVIAKAAYNAGLERAAEIAGQATKTQFNDEFWKTKSGKDKTTTLDAKSVVYGIANAIIKEISNEHSITEK